MTYYLQDNPNPTFGQYGWLRKKVSGVVGVHTAENNTDFDGADPGAEDVARWLTRRADPGSYHAIADADSRIKLIHPRYAAWADTTNNAHAMSVSGAMQAARWRELTPARAAAITRNMAYAAAELVKDAIAAGLLGSPVPARRITPAEAIAGSKAGFYGHGETNPGRRYDPGQNFDWNLFLTTYASAIGGIAAMGTTTPQASEEDDMAVTPSFEPNVRASLQNLTDTLAKLSPLDRDLRAAFNGVTAFQRDVRADLEAKGQQITALTAAVGTLAGIVGNEQGLDVEQIKQAVTEAIASGIKITVEAGK